MVVEVVEVLMCSGGALGTKFESESKIIKYLFNT